MTQEALKDLLDVVEAAIQAGDWKVDGACDPELAIRRAKQALAQSEQKDEKGRPMTYWGGMAQPEDHRRGADNQKASEQEPVAWPHKYGCRANAFGKCDMGCTTPIQRTWVGLTHAEVDSWELPDCPTVFEFAQFIEAKLKQKNGYAEEKNI